MKIRNVAVIVQNNIQFEAFKNAIDIMIQKEINVDIYIPTCDDDSGFGDMFDDFYRKMENSNYNTFRKTLDKSYDILFETYKNDIFNNLKRKLTIKYMYALTTKSSYSLSLQINYIFDGFLCFGKEDSESLKNYGLTFQIGNIKYLNYHQESYKRKGRKPTLLYLPTYSSNSSIELVAKELVKLKNNYNIIVKPHHGTEYLNNDLEINRRNFLHENFNEVFSSKDSLCDLLKKTDIVLTDMSGAVFDAIYVNKPVVMYYNMENCKYGDYISLPVQYAQSGYFVSFNDLETNSLDFLLKKALDRKQIKKQNDLSKLLFSHKNDEVKDAFLAFLDSVENNIFTDNYLKIHNIQKNEISQLLNNNLSLNEKVAAINGENENLNTKIDSLNKIINDKDDLIKQQDINIKEINLKNINLQDELNILENKLSDIYKSTSWRITKPMRIIKNFFNKLK